MNLESLKEKWFEIVNKANANGVPVPLVRDAKTGLGSMSLTLVFISFNVWLVSVIGKTAGYLGGMNPDQCLNMFLACAGLYWGRKFQQSESGKGSLDGKSEQ